MQSILRRLQEKFPTYNCEISEPEFPVPCISGTNWDMRQELNFIQRENDYFFEIVHQSGESVDEQTFKSEKEALAYFQ
jgi:hypothetical protein